MRSSRRYLDALAPSFAGTAPDVTEENIQARVRGDVLMALSNKLGALLLSTGNKSELAVGYCTLYGDMCGGLAVISDVPKTLVYELARYVNREGATSSPSRRSPSRRAPSCGRTRPTPDTLPPYDVLDPIVEAYVERDLSPGAIVAAGLRPGARRASDRGLIDVNEYKRRQAAPGIEDHDQGVRRRAPVPDRRPRRLKGGGSLFPLEAPEEDSRPTFQPTP